jgi:predicted phosphodiesterase
MYDDEHKLLYINPGAAGNYGFHKAITFLRFDIENKKPVNLEVFHHDRE